MTPEAPTKRRGAPPTDAGPPPAPAITPTPAVIRLQAEEQARLTAAQDADRALRASLDTYRTRAAACVTRLRDKQPEVAARCAEVQSLKLPNYRLALGGHSTIVRDLESALAELDVLYHGRSNNAGTTPSLLADLARIPARIDGLTAAKDFCRCPPPPPPHRCAPGRIRADVENAEDGVARIPQWLTSLAENVALLESAARARGRVGVPDGSNVARHDPTPAREPDFDPFR
jgi:hypothetical protein